MCQSTYCCCNSEYVRVPGVCGISARHLGNFLQSISDSIWMNKQLTCASLHRTSTVEVRVEGVRQNRTGAREWCDDRVVERADGGGVPEQGPFRK